MKLIIHQPSLSTITIIPQPLRTLLCLEGWRKMITENKRWFLLGGILFVALIVGLTLYGAYQKEKQKEDSIKEFDSQRDAVLQESSVAELDFQRAFTFIQNHLPTDYIGYDDYSTPVNFDVEPEAVTVLSLEKSLLNKDVSQWITYFTSEALSEAMNQLQGKTLDERTQELERYIDSMTRGDILTKLSLYQLDKQYMLLFQYEDGIEVEIPVEFKVIKAPEVVIKTDVLTIIEAIKNASN